MNTLLCPSLPMSYWGASQPQLVRVIRMNSCLPITGKEQSKTSKNWKRRRDIHEFMKEQQNSATRFGRILGSTMLRRDVWQKIVYKANRYPIESQRYQRGQTPEKARWDQMQRRRKSKNANVLFKQRTWSNRGSNRRIRRILCTAHHKRKGLFFKTDGPRRRLCQQHH